MSYHSIFLSDKHSRTFERLRNLHERMTGDRVTHPEFCRMVIEQGLEFWEAKTKFLLESVRRSAEEEAAGGPDAA